VSVPGYLLDEVFKVTGEEAQVFGALVFAKAQSPFQIVDDLWRTDEAAIGEALPLLDIAEDQSVWRVFRIYRYNTPKSDNFLGTEDWMALEDMENAKV
jgi:hypothetical protein